ncbi:MAG: glycosyltransferase family 4 protein [Chloroflexi bacterium]|nr:glycosyltransferase family 4 protein [Chloroflexota bacterium]
MKIALLTLSFWPVRGGMEYVVHDLATALHDGGHDVTVFAPRWKNLPDELPHRYRLERFGWNFKGAFRYGFNKWPLKRAFGQLHGEAPFDVINSHSAYLTTSYAMSLRRKFGVPVVVTCHGHDIQRHPETGYGLRLDPKKDRLIKANLEAVDLAVSISSSIDEDLIEVMPRQRFVSIPNGVGVGTAGTDDTPWLREAVGTTSDVIVLSVGRNVPKKSLAVGVEAFALALKYAPNLRYVHIGRDGEALTTQAEALGVGDRFHALGEQPRPKTLQAYEEADIFFSPAAMESFGIVTFEAMTASLPSVVSDGPGNRDAIEDGRTGILAPVDDTEAMARALVKLASDESLRSEYGCNARDVVAEFAWPRVAERYVAAFESVTSSTMTDGQ